MVVGTAIVEAVRKALAEGKSADVVPAVAALVGELAAGVRDVVKAAR